MSGACTRTSSVRRAIITQRVIAHEERPIEISWSSRKLEKACATDKLGQRTWGAEHWRLLRRRLASLRAASTLMDMDGVPGHCHALHKDRRDQFAVNLWSSYRIVEVVDYHGD